MVTGNTLLDSLPSRELALLRADLRPVDTPRRTRLLEAGAPTDAVDFPVSLVVSLTLQTGEGDPIEVAMVGPEGMLGTWIASAIDTAPWSAVAQVAGTSLRCGAADLRRVLAHAPVLSARIEQYALTQTYFMSQSILCNRFHELLQRTARWLLILATKTRTGAAPLPVTQEILSQMLGVHRPSVTLALQALTETGMIRSAGRGRIAILDRDGLEAAACECFRQVRAFNLAVTGHEDASFAPLTED
ncbi:MAG: Crp/Fnr family transcriptional regulator [Dehalococcoidia bacterium]